MAFIAPIFGASSAARKQAALVPETTSVSGTKEVGDLQDFALPGLLAEGLDLGAFQAQDRDHAAWRGIGGLLHRRPALLHHHQALVEIHDAGEDHGRIFAQAQSGRRLAGHTTSGDCTRNDSSAARLVTNRAGWL